MKFFPNKRFAIGALSLLLSPALFGFTSLPETSQSASRADRLLSLQFPRSPGGKGPSRTASGGSRSVECSVVASAIPITVLMPADNVGTTVAADPNLFLYIPESRIDGGQVIINDETGAQPVYDKEFNLSNKPSNASGIVKLSLKGANLEPDKTYTWSFMPFCYGDTGLAETIGLEVKGQFRRMSLTPAENARLGQVNTPLQRAQVYADAGVWNETLTLIRELSSTAPQEWRTLIESVGLENLARAPYFGESPLFSDTKIGAEASDRVESSPTMAPSAPPIEGLW